jgi:hypothetical protein
VRVIAGEKTGYAYTAEIAYDAITPAAADGELHRAQHERHE